MLIDSNSCNVQPMDRSLGMPGEGPKMVPLSTDFTLNDTYEVDLSNFVQMGRISMVQSIYVDNADGAVAITILVELGSQRLIVPAGQEAYLPILVPNPIKLTISSPGGAASAKVFLINFPIQPEVWNSAGGSGAFPSAAPEFDQVSTDLELPVLTIDLLATGNNTAQIHAKNIGANAVVLSFYNFNREDEVDIELTDSFTVAPGAITSENMSGTRFNRMTIISSVAGLPGELAGGVWVHGA
jgi:hypothetical protein